MRLALAQLRVEPAAVEANVQRALDAVATAADRGADLVALPELFAVGFFSFDAYARSAEPVGGSIHRRLADAAREHRIAVLAGSVVEDLAATRETTDLQTPSREGLANTAVLFDADGDRRALYRKHHLFGYDSEEATRLTPGEDIEGSVADIGGFTVAVSTCYDLRFPELYRALGERGATLFLVPSAWPYPRVEHWRALPQARAIENLAYVAAVNGTGSFPAADAELLGRSTVYDPWGTTIAGSGDDPTLVLADLDSERVAAVREEFPALRDRRF